MAFMQSNNFNNNNTGDKPKVNFPLGRVYASDGVIDLSTWNAQTGTRIILTIKAAIGKDPTTGANVLEQKKPNELPRFFFNVESVRAFIEAASTGNVTDMNGASFGRGNNTLNINVMGNQIKITINSDKNGSRTATLDAVPVGNKNIHAAWNNMVDLIKMGHKRALTFKMDANEFNLSDDNEESAE